CADGQCFANPLTSGYYPTRWRRWPLEYAETTPVSKLAPLPESLKQEVNPFEAPEPKDEDRRAPEPSVPRAEEETSGARPAGRPAGTTGPGPGPMTQPPSSGSGLP